MTTRISRRAIACALLSTSVLSSAAFIATPAQAQLFSSTQRRAPDGNGVDVISGKLDVGMRSVSIGQAGGSSLAYVNGWLGGRYFDTFKVEVAGASGSPDTVTRITIFGEDKSFTRNADGSFTNNDADGATFAYDSATGTYVYTAADGTVFKFLKSLGDTGLGALILARISTVTWPNGEVWTYTHNVQPGIFCSPTNPSCHAQLAVGRVQSLDSNLGFQLKPAYASNTVNSTTWKQLTTVTAVNKTIDYCSPTADTCTFSQAWPQVTIGTSASGSTTTQTFTDSNSQTTTVTSGSNGVTSVTPPSSSGQSVTYDANGRVATFALGGGTWTYTYADSGSQRTTTVTQPLGGSKVYVSDLNLTRVLSVTDELNRTTSFQYDGSGRLTRVTQPEGNYIQYTYDARGNVTEERHVAKAGSGLADIVTSAAFPASCSNPKICNQPTSTTDPRGNTTDFTYDSNHGGLLTVTKPAPTTGAVRPQARYGYTALTAYYKNSSGVIAAAPSSVYKLTSISACQTLSSCSGGADEVKSSLTYGTSGVANNLYVTSVSSGAGDGSLTATRSATYDQFGNLLTLDGPLSGSADTSGFQYDADRRLTLSISPDPDGAGALKMRARRYTYNADGNVTRIEAGTTTSLTGTFTPVSTFERVDFAYDTLGRRSLQSLVSGPTIATVVQTVTQFSYDDKGRPECATVRMSPAATLPASACTLATAGSFGPDRITKAVYDNADQVTQIQEGVGTSDAANERTLTYNPNGTIATLKDAENNLTTYVRDGFDRLSKTQYPSDTKGSATSNPADYVQLGYDAGSNVISRRLRDGTSIGLTYDNLGRVTAKDLPGTEPDISYAYDNLDRMTSASQIGNALSFTYDSLGRRLTETGPQGTTTSQYDLAGRRTQLTYPGTGLLVNYDYFTTGEVSKIRENGAISGAGVLATYGYDDEGRPTSLTFGNGVVQNFAYDPVSRLASLANDLPGTANDLTHGFAYNPASQITSLTRSNDAYGFTKTSVSESGTANGLNELTAYAGNSVGYDTRANLSAFGLDTYGYSSENALTSATVAGVSSTLTYDALTRLQTLSSGGVTQKLAYDGLNSIAEYDGSNALLRRYVFDVSGEPVVWYEGATIGSTTRRFLSADERGSIISVTDNSGNLLGTNTYDEYGQPGGANLGAFGYTGQRWLPSLKLWHYKSRVYSSAIGGRFMQTDPIGYTGSGPNLFAYVLNDPVNSVDSLGTSKEVVCTGSHIAQDKPCSETSTTANILPSFPGGGTFGTVGGGGSGHWEVQGGEPTTLGANGEIIVTGGNLVWVPDSELAQNDLLPNFSGEGLAIWFKEEFRGGLKQLRDKVHSLHCSLSNISPSRVNEAARQGTGKGIVKGAVLGAAEGWLAPPAEPESSVAGAVLGAELENSADDAESGIAGSIMEQICSG